VPAVDAEEVNMSNGKSCINLFITRYFWVITLVRETDSWFIDRVLSQIADAVLYFYGSVWACRFIHTDTRKTVCYSV